MTASERSITVTLPLHCAIEAVATLEDAVKTIGAEQHAAFSPRDMVRARLAVAAHRMRAKVNEAARTGGR